MNILKSEFYKLKHTWILWAHFILPVLYALLFYGAATFTGLKNFSDMDIIQNYFVLLGAILPIIFGAVTSKVVDMEASAGRFQVILSTTKSRSKAYGGKLIMLLLSFLFSMSLAVFIFAMLFGNQGTMAWLIELLLVFIGCLSTYMIHLWVSIMLGGGAINVADIDYLGLFVLIVAFIAVRKKVGIIKILAGSGVLGLILGLIGKF